MSCPQYLFHYLGFLVLIGRSKLGKEVMHLLRIYLEYNKNSHICKHPCMAKVYLVKKCYSKRKCHNKLDDTSSSAHCHCFDFFHLLVFIWTFQLLGHRSHFDQ